MYIDELFFSLVTAILKITRLILDEIFPNDMTIENLKDFPKLGGKGQLTELGFKIFCKN